MNKSIDLLNFLTENELYVYENSANNIISGNFINIIKINRDGNNYYRALCYNFTRSQIYYNIL